MRQATSWPADGGARRRERAWLPPVATAIILVTASLPVFADGLTALVMSSDPGDYVGQGKNYSYTTADGDFSADPTWGGVTITLRGDDQWSLLFVPPSGAALVPGVYEDAVRYTARAPSKPGIDIAGLYRGCNAATGRFTVLEAAYGSNGEVLKFAADFEQHCEGAAPALFGSVRFNSSVPLGLRVSVSPAAAYEGDGEPASLSFTISLSARATAPISVAYTTADGSARAGIDYTAVSGIAYFNIDDVTARVDVPILGNTVPQSNRVLSLLLSDASGASIAFGQAPGTIVDDDSGRTFMQLVSQPGDFIGKGESYFRTALDGDFAVRYPRRSIEISFMSYSLHEGWPESWDFIFAPPAGTILSPGVYDGGTGYGLEALARPILDVSGSGRGCNRVAGRFEVLEVEYNADGNVERLAVDFEQHCEGVTPALFGSIRYNSLVSVEPRVSVGSTAQYEGDGEPTNLAFRLSLSTPLQEPVTVAYTTVDGTARAGADYTPVSGTATFNPGETAVTVSVPILGNTAPQLDRTLTLALSNAAGAAIGLGQAIGTIVDDDSGRTVIELHSQPGDCVGGGQDFRWTALDGDITISNDRGGVQFGFDGGSWNAWNFYFAPPAGTAFAPGVYEGATRYSFQSPAKPGLDVNSGGAGGCEGCNTLKGRFEVLEVEYGADGSVRRLAVDFEQHCEGGAAALFGSVRYNSLVPIQPRVSAANAVNYEGDGEPVSLAFWLSLSTPASAPVTVSYASADGTARAGVDYTATSGTVTFAPGQTCVKVDVPVLGNSVPQPDRTLRLVLSNLVGAALGFGEATGTIVDDDTTRSLVYLDSDPQDYIGQGQELWLRPLDGPISVESGGGAVYVHSETTPNGGWHLYFYPPVGQVLGVGPYGNAVDLSSRTSTSPGLDVDGDSRGCNAITGQFRVLEIGYDATGQVQRFAVDFEQHCEGGTPALFGSVRYNSFLPVTPRRTLHPPIARKHLRRL